MGFGLATVTMMVMGRSHRVRCEVVTGVDTCNGSPGHDTEQDGVDTGIP